MRFIDTCAVCGLATTAALLTAAPAFAQGPAAANRVQGVVTAVSAKSVTVKGTDGKATVVGFDKSVQVMISRPIKIETIKPGMYVATANTNIDANIRSSIDLPVLASTATMHRRMRWC